MSEENTNSEAEAGKAAPSTEVISRGGQPTLTQQSQEPVDRADDDGTDDDADRDGEEGDGEEEGKRRGKSRSERQARKIERLQAELSELKSVRPGEAVKDTSAVEAAVKARIGEPPKEDDFSDYFDYRDAKAAYEAKKGIVELQITEDSSRQQRTQIERITNLADDYQDNLKEAAEQIPDLMETLDKSKFVPHKGLEILILEAGEKAPLVSYYLAQNPEIADRLNAMPERQALREMGRIEALVSPPKSKATAAPTPIRRPKGGSPSRGIGKSMSDYERWRDQE